jgi:hypothetical protein
LRAGEGHERHLDGFEQGRLLIIFGNNGECEFLTRNRQDLTQWCTKGAAIECDTSPCGGSIDSFFRSRSGSSGRQLFEQVFIILVDFARDTSGTVSSVHTRGNGRCDCLAAIGVVIIDGYPWNDSFRDTDLLIAAYIDQGKTISMTDNLIELNGEGSL